MNGSNRRKKPIRFAPVGNLPKGDSTMTNSERDFLETKGTASNELIDEGMSELLAQFETLLREEPDFDQATREALAGQLRDGMVAAVGSTEQLPEGLFDKSSWNEAVESLRKMGAISSSEADDVTRRLSEALAPLDRRESKLAVEFSRRLADEGEEKALVWLKQAHTAVASDGSASLSDLAGEAKGLDARPITSEITRSRSRRLRGPPFG